MYRTAPPQPGSAADPRWRPAHAVGLFALAVAQPSLEAFARHPTFFAAHRADAPLIFGIAGVFCLAAPVGVALLALGSRRWPALVAALLFLLGWLLVQAPIDRMLVEWPAAQPFVGSAFALALFLALRAFVFLRRMLELLAWSPPLIALLFLAHPAVSAFWRPGPAPPAVEPPAEKLVVLLFDELPLLTLLEPASTLSTPAVDRRFPAFEALAATSTWYTGATSAGSFTNVAVPALVRSRHPGNPGSQADGDLFRAFGPKARFDVRELATGLCPPRLCANEGAGAPLTARLGRVLADWSALFLHQTLPAGWRGRLPPVEHLWRDFWHWQTPVDDRLAAAEAFVAGLPAGDGRPRVVFLHTLLPHNPFEFLPDGRRYRHGAVLAMGKIGDPLDRLQLLQLHLLQTQATDTLLGRTREHLERLGLWDEAWVVVTADHGLTLRPGRPQRGVGDVATLRSDILPVPLFVKAPGQRQAAIDPRPFEQVDLFPTLFDRMGASWPFAADGRVLPVDPTASLPESSFAARFFGVDPAAWRAEEGALAEALRWKSGLPGLEPSRDDFYSVVPRPELLGTEAEPARPAPELTAFLWSTRAELDYRPERPFNDLLVIGELADPPGSEPFPPPGAVVTVSIDGRVRGVGGLRRPQLVSIAETMRARVARPGAGGPWLFTCVLDPAGLKPGRHRLELALVASSGRGRSLAVEPLFLTEP